MPHLSQTNSGLPADRAALVISQAPVSQTIHAPAASTRHGSASVARLWRETPQKMFQSVPFCSISYLKLGTLWKELERF